VNATLEALTNGVKEHKGEGFDVEKRAIIGFVNW